MIHRIEIYTKINDSKSFVVKQKLESLNFPINSVLVAEVYTINKKFTKEDLAKIAELLSNSISQSYLVDKGYNDSTFDYALEIGFLPGVTDNIATTAKETIKEALNVNFSEEEGVYTSTLYFLSGKLTEDHIKEIASQLANGLIQRSHIKSHEKFAGDNGMDYTVPKVSIHTKPKTDHVNLNQLTETELIKLGKEGIENSDGSRRGPLALDLPSLLAIKQYFIKENRNPTDIELESIAQTWSEHCKHTIFSSEIDEIKDGLYKHYIKRATHEIRKKMGDSDFCVSVFSDNSGGIIFNKDWIVTNKAETHNSPSALDPFGGAITGIVGVNRDAIGFGLGAKPIINTYGFCVGLPDDTTPLYKDSKKELKMLSPKRILEGVVEGVNAGGNQSGIPTPSGFVCFDDRFKGKPLVFVGTVGLIPTKINGKNSWEKSAKNGDKIVVIGGRVGQDGIHGATFSSEALSTHSPATAVQIGDPITQKKLSDALIKEVRDLGLYNSITDNGAGGLSCSVAEMAKECGGCVVELEKVPLKYPNLDPWKIWISESQERMTLAIPDHHIDRFFEIMKKWGVESTIIGEFNSSTRCVVKYNNEVIFDLDMDFLHDGIPPKKIITQEYISIQKDPSFDIPSNLTETLLRFMERPNICSYKYISTQYDHTVQGTSVIGPLQGKGEVNGPFSLTKPFPASEKAIMLSHGINPAYSDVCTYDMACCAIDTAIRNVVAGGGAPEKIALMDNFCWCDSTNPIRLYQLKRAAQACYDCATHYETPFISGKDSMFNEFNGFDENGTPLKITIPPTLLVSSMTVLDNIHDVITIDPKKAGDLIYIVGDTYEEMGSSEYFISQADDATSTGKICPKVQKEKALEIYKKIHSASKSKLINSNISPNIGGVVTALVKKCIASNLGMEIHLKMVPNTTGVSREDYLLFSETQSRFILTISPENKEKFEELFKNLPHAQIGVVNSDENFIIYGINEAPIIKTNSRDLTKAYNKTFKNF